MSPVEGDEEDPTRKQRSDQPSARRKVLKEAETPSAVLRMRLARLGIVLAVVAITIAVVLIGSGGGTKTVVSGTKKARETTTNVDSAIGGIPQSGNMLGSPTAPVTLQYFGDLECPTCREFSLEALPSIIQRWVRSGKLKIEYRSFRAATRNLEVFKTQQVAALAAGKQDKMWYFVELFYYEQGEEDSGYVTESYLRGIASQVPGLNLPKWISDRSEPALADEVTADGQAAINEGLTGTPSFLIGRSGSAMKKLGKGLLPLSSFDEGIEKVLME
jgi:protein-disulfide isomerase